MRHIRRMRIRTLILLVVFLVAGGVSASEILDGEFCTVAADEVIEGDLFAFCGELRIEGRVEGSILGAARTATITGKVTGSIYVIASELIFNGEVSKDLHFAGLVLDVRDNARFLHEDSSIIGLSLSQTISENTHVPGNISNLGYQLIVNGDVDGEINFWGSALHIGGVVKGDVRATVGNAASGGASSQIQTLLIPFPLDLDLVDPGLVLLEGARIEGILEYSGPTRGAFRSNQLSQPAIYHPKGTTFDVVEPTSAASLRRYLGRVLREFATLAFISLIFLLVVPRQMQSPLRYMQARPVSTLGVGMLSFVMSFPIVLIMALLSIFIIFIMSLLPINTVVIFSGVVLGLANIGAASIFYFTAIYVARMVVALGLGRFIMRVFKRYDGSTRSLFLSLMIGDLFLALATTFPISIIGWGINAIAAFLGLGAILILLQAKVKAFLDSAPNAPVKRSAYGSAVSAKATTPRRLPFLTDRSRIYQSTIAGDQVPAGMENLPEGFDWWGEDED